MLAIFLQFGIYQNCPSSPWFPLLFSPMLHFITANLLCLLFPFVFSAFSFLLALGFKLANILKSSFNSVFPSSYCPVSSFSPLFQKQYLYCHLCFVTTFSPEIFVRFCPYDFTETVLPEILTDKIKISKSKGLFSVLILYFCNIGQCWFLLSWNSLPFIYTIGLLPLSLFIQ